MSTVKIPLKPTWVKALAWTLPQSADWDTTECTVYNIDMPNDNIEVLSEITDIEIIAIGNSIRDLDRLEKKHGRGRWRKLKGFANVRLPDSTTCFAEIHWYEAHGIGKRDIKVKRILGK